MSFAKFVVHLTVECGKERLLVYPILKDGRLVFNIPQKTPVPSWRSIGNSKGMRTFTGFKVLELFLDSLLLK